MSCSEANNTKWSSTHRPYSLHKPSCARTRNCPKMAKTLPFSQKTYPKHFEIPFPRNESTKTSKSNLKYRKPICYCFEFPKQWNSSKTSLKFSLNARKVITKLKQRRICKNFRVFFTLNLEEPLKIALLQALQTQNSLEDQNEASMGSLMVHNPSNSS